MLISAIAVFAFLGLIVLALRLVVVRRGDWSGARTRRAATVLIVYVIAVGLTSVISRRDLWPFSSWSLMAGTAPDGVGVNPPGDFVLAVDAHGKEYEIDYRALEPFTFEELYTWLPHLAELPAASQAQVGAELLLLANAGRERVRAGEHPGYFDRWLGPLTAPHHFLHPAIWTRPEDVPREPFVACRVYREFWTVDARRLNATDVRRELVYEYRAPQ